MRYSESSPRILLQYGNAQSVVGEKPSRDDCFVDDLCVFSGLMSFVYRVVFRELGLSLMNDNNSKGRARVARVALQESGASSLGGVGVVITTNRSSKV